MEFEIPAKPDANIRRRDYIPQNRIELIPEDPERSRWDDDADVKYFPALILRWETGGTNGEGNWLEGDCRSRSYATGTPEPLWEDLDTILEHFCPTITYLRYR